jgi:outer membrane protein OmpA-like peptidoglycan-associated protein
MRYYLHSLIFLFLLTSFVLEAQTEVSIRKKDFKVSKTGFDDAWKHIINGNEYYSEKGIWYGNAFDEYLQAIVYNNSSPELNYKTGVSALFSDRKEEAAGFLLKALELKKDVAGDILLLAGRSLQFSGRFNEAIEKFNDYLNTSGKKTKENISLAKKCIEECNSAIIMTKDTLRIGIDNIGVKINSGADDYSEIISADGTKLFFASRRQITGSGRPYPDSKFDENIFISMNNNGLWTEPVTAGKKITTKYCETPLFINAANDRLYIYAGYENRGDIKMSVSKKGEWETPGKTEFGINSKGSETSFSISPSGNEIYYVTDNGKDNMGGKDIYIIKKVKEHKWSEPQNAGPSINTIFDEESVRFSKSGDTLWFSSKGHNSIGGFDIFYSVKDQSGNWSLAKNFGYPVNTPWDELFYLPLPEDDSAFYFVSNRTGGFGGLDIYQGRILAPEPVVEIVTLAPAKTDTVVIRDTVVVVKPLPEAPVIKNEPVEELVLYLTGKVKDSESGEPVLAKIDVIDVASNAVVAITASSDENGSYRVRLPAKKSYILDLRATGYLSDNKRINIPVSYSQDFYKLDIDLIKVKVGKKVVLNKILFESGKAVLTAGSYIELNRLLNIMQDNSLMKIEISGHTDKTGTEPVNFKLSEARAKAVVEFLVSKGIDRIRMEYKGYGSLQPIADNTTPQGRAKNRRVEFKILEF